MESMPGLQETGPLDLASAPSNRITIVDLMILVAGFAIVGTWPWPPVGAGVLVPIVFPVWFLVLVSLVGLSTIMGFCLGLVLLGRRLRQGGSTSPVERLAVATTATMVSILIPRADLVPNWFIGLVDRNPNHIESVRWT
jgi:hypothetical protein